MTRYRNAEHAFIGELRRLDRDGNPVEVRGHLTREVVGRAFTILDPVERCVTTPGRLNSIAATVAETMWVLAGRNDLEFLTHYLPRAADFSDDGTTWRAGYGPRLRNWSGVDQLAAVRELLLADPRSRRAVMNLFDPAVDFAPSRDVPCNNWLHFLRRDDVLDMSIAVRSNDIIWGFSGINTFEWSVIHELLARWTGSRVGPQNWFVSSMHVYERHFTRARATVEQWSGVSCYERGYSPIRYEGSWSDLPEHLERWFALEDAIRTGEPSAAAVAAFPEPLFRAFLQVVSAHWRVVRAASDVVDSKLNALEGTDLGFAVAEYVQRRTKGAQDTEALSSSPNEGDQDLQELRRRLRLLHREKSAAYGDSWKRRGEAVSVLANIARKVDRLENIDAWFLDDPESVVDTLADLFTYLLKYQTFLADADPVLANELFSTAVPGPKSDGFDGFEYLLARAEPAESSLHNPHGMLAHLFEDLHETVVGSRTSAVDKSARVVEMSRVCLSALLNALQATPARPPGTTGSTGERAST